MNQEKKKMVWLVIAVIVLVSVVLGAAYSYFIAKAESGASTNVTITTGTTDSLLFTTGPSIKIAANQDNFASGKGNRSGSTTATATLKAGTNHTASDTYNVYLNILANNFEYAVNANTPELILKLTDPTGQNVTSISGLTYNTAAGGFDITTTNGQIKLVSNYTISTSSTEEQTWTAEIIFLNLDSDQNKNTGKVFTGDLILGKGELTTLASYIKNLYTAQGSNGLYLHDTSLTNSAGDNSYRYAGADPNNYICFGSDEAQCSTDDLYRIIGVINNQVKLIKYDYATSDLLGTDGAYTSTSPFATLEPDYYKGSLTKSDPYLWNNSAGESSTNDWTTSNLNIINLNTNYLKNIGPNWENKISDTVWKIGGIDAMVATTNAKGVYDSEVGSNSVDKSYTGKVALVYLSDYMYAAAPTYWASPAFDPDSTDYSSAANDNWMLMGAYEWILTPESAFIGTASDKGAFGIAITGAAFTSTFASMSEDGANFGVFNPGTVIRPVFNLKASIPYVSGTGTKTDPYRI